MAKESTREQLLAKMRQNLNVDGINEASVATEAAQPLSVQPVIQQSPEVQSVISPANVSGRKSNVEKEVKTRTSITLYPNQLRDVKRIAAIKRESVSEVICALLDKYIKNNQDALQEFYSLPVQAQQKIDSTK